MSLTKGGAKMAIRLASAAEDRSFQPVFQVIQIEEIQNAVGAERFRVLLSDGQNLVPAMISTQLNPLVTANEIEEDSLIIVNDFMNTAVQGRNVLILLEAQVLRKTAKRIGKPTENVDGGGDTEAGVAFQKQQNEISRFEALNILLTDESLSDIKLVSEIDNSEVLAHRNMLGARSRVFRDMLYGELSSASTVELPYPGTTLKAVVAYIYTNHIPDPAEFIDQPNDFVSLLVSTIDAATYFGLPTFVNKLEGLAKTEIDLNPRAYAIRFLAMCGRFNNLATNSKSPITKIAIQKVCRSPGLLMENDSILPLLSYAQVKYIVWNPDILSDELTLLRVIESWANVTNDRFTSEYEIHKLEEDKIASLDDSSGIMVSGCDGNNGGSGVDENDFAANRQEAARNLTKYINLAAIPPSKLVSVAATSDLISQEQLFGAFKAQAYLAEKKTSGIFLETPRYPVWESSNSLTLAAPKSREYYTLELLKCRQPLTKGIYTWSVLMQETSEWICIGVASSQHELIHDTLLGAQPGGWALSVDGTVTHNNSYEQATGLQFKKNSTVTFILDLTGPGTLSGVVDEKFPPTTLFTDMFSAFEGGKEAGGGFVPAVELYPSDKVKFLGFDREDDDEEERGGAGEVSAASEIDDCDTTTTNDDENC